jgi:hypothetical protein
MSNIDLFNQGSFNPVTHIYLGVPSPINILFIKWGL